MSIKKQPFIISKTELEETYLKEQLKLKEIAAKYNVSISSVNRKIKEFKISRKKSKLFFPEGNKFGYLTVIKIGGIKNGHRCWECKCACGAEREIEGFRLKHELIKSCGECNIFINDNHHSWKGYEEITGFIWNTQIRRGAKRRGKKFDISIEYTWELFLKQNKRCPLSGEALHFEKEYKNRWNTTASLDRIDNAIGYVEGNVRWVHKKINIMRNDMSDKELIEWCGKIYNYGKRKEN